MTLNSHGTCCDDERCCYYAKSLLTHTYVEIIWTFGHHRTARKKLVRSDSDLWKKYRKIKHDAADAPVLKKTIMLWPPFSGYLIQFFVRFFPLTTVVNWAKKVGQSVKAHCTFSCFPRISSKSVGLQWIIVMFGPFLFFIVIYFISIHIFKYIFICYFLFCFF